MYPQRCISLVVTPDALGEPDPVDDSAFNSFQIIGFTHPHCWLVGLAGCLITHREKINTENREIEKGKAKEIY